MDNTTLENLVRKFRNTDKKRYFEEIYRYFLPKIYRFITLQVQDVHSSEDLTAEVFIKVYRNLERAKPGAKTISPWIYRIARNTVIDHYRKTGKRSKEVSIDGNLKNQIEDLSVDSVNNRYSYRGTSDDLDFSNEMLLNSLQKLPELQRQVLLLRYIEDMDYISIGMILNRSAGSVRAIKFRALFKLRSILKGKK